MPETATKPRKTKAEPEANGHTDAAPDTPEAVIEKLRKENEQLKAKLAEGRDRKANIRKLRDELDKMKKAVKGKKAQIEEAVMALVADRDEQPGLFDRTKPPSENGKAVAADDSWKALPCGTLQEVPKDPLPATIVGKLAENDCATLGQLSDLMNKATSDGKQWWDLFTGIGPGKAEQVEKALDAFWEAHPEYCKSNAQDAVNKVAKEMGTKAPEKPADAPAEPAKPKLFESADGAMPAEKKEEGK